MTRHDQLKGIDYLQSPISVRESCGRVFDLSRTLSQHFQIHLDQIDGVADLVIDTMKQQYPNGEIPYHARLRHFNCQGIDRVSRFAKRFEGASRQSYAKALVDLIVVSVLVDAGAGDHWVYHERDNPNPIGRSEGLAIASYDMFNSGLFSYHYAPEATAKALIHLPLDSLAHGFQVSDDNPLLGLEGRKTLLNNLGKTLEAYTHYFPGQRPGGLVDYFLTNFGNRVSASRLLTYVLRAFGPIWPTGTSFQEKTLGDAWLYPPFKNHESEVQRYVVFHKLSQWLTYSLIEALEIAGVTVYDLDELTGLAEYRNGGLFVDGGVLKLLDPENANKAHSVDSPLIIEWRALTVALLDQLAVVIRKKLSMDAATLPLAKILEGGTWKAGRDLAFARDPKGSSPINIISTGTTF
ncbi:MAG: DUF1688 family protein [Pseudobacteriovorax sp.]|nr:DUF1688 family protein [Pseudobacteriovorax sp.]